MGEPSLLEVRRLAVHFDTADGVVRAVDGLDLRLDEGEALGLVGESGSGKSVTALALLRLVPTPPGRYAGGSVRFDGRELLDAPEAAVRAVRGRGMAMVFQDPLEALNPVLTVGAQVAEGFRVHGGASRREARRRAVELLARLGIADAERRADDHPHELSGGQQQRAMLAVALASEPRLLIADEPTTALDVTVQAQLLALLRQVRERRGTALLLISHDLDLVAGVVDRVVVMYAGRAVEEAPAGDLLRRAAHPYTRALLAGRPRLDGERVRRLDAIPGRPPRPGEAVAGCPFHPRCPHAVDRCRADLPRLRPAGAGQRAACHRLEELA